MRLVRDEQQMQIMSITTFLMVFGAHVTILNNVKMNIL